MTLFIHQLLSRTEMNLITIHLLFMNNNKIKDKTKQMCALYTEQIRKKKRNLLNILNFAGMGKQCNFTINCRSSGMPEYHIYVLLHQFSNYFTLLIIHL